MEIPVRIVHDRPIATVTLNSTEVSMLVDSGAFFSMLSPSAAAQLDLPLRNLPFEMRLEGYTGSIEARMTRVERLGLRGAEIPKVPFIVGGNEMGAGIMGLLGRNILSIADTEYDLAHGVIRLTTPSKDCEKANLAYWAGEAPVVQLPLEANRNSRDTAVRVAVAINGKRTIALMDTGAPETTLTLKTAKAAGITRSDLVADGHSGGAGAGRADSYLGLVGTFELGGEKISNNKIRIDDNDYFEDGALLGLDYFLAHRIYVSRLQGMVYATWNGGPIFAQQKGGDPKRYDQSFAARPTDLPQDNADALARRGTAAAANRDWAQADEDLTRAIALAPTVPSYFVDRARVRLDRKKTRDALADLDEAVRLSPSNPEARLLRAIVHRTLRQDAEAKADVDVLDAQLPPSAQQRITMAAVYVELGQLTQALRQWSLWMPTHESDQQYARVLNERCWMRARLAVDLNLAIDDCKEAISRNKTNSNYRDSLGWAYLRAGDAQRARKAFDAALEIEPDKPWSLYGRGLAWLQLKDASASQRDLQEARKLSPGLDDEVREQGFGAAPDAPAPAPTQEGRSAAGGDTSQSL